MEGGEEDQIKESEDKEAEGENGGHDVEEGRRDPDMFGLQQTVDQEGRCQPQEATGNPDRDRLLETDRDVWYRGVPLGAVIEGVGAHPVQPDDGVRGLRRLGRHFTF